MPISRRRLFLGLAALFAALGGGAVTRTLFTRYYDGPVSDHFDGERFFDAHSSPLKKTTDLLRFFSGRGEAWPERAPSAHSDRPPTRVDGKAIRVSYVGHVSVLIQTASLNILCDPVWSGHTLRGVAADRPRPRFALPLRPSRRRDAVAACSYAPSARHHAARQ